MIWFQLKKNPEICFVFYHAIFPKQCSMRWWEECALCSCCIKCYVNICWVPMLENAILFLLVIYFCLDDMSCAESGMLKCPSIFILDFPLTFDLIKFTLCIWGFWCSVNIYLQSLYTLVEVIPLSLYSNYLCLCLSFFT